MSTKLSNNLAEVNSQAKEITAFAKDLAKVIATQIPEGMEEVLLLSTKIATIVKELSAYTEQIVQKQIEKGKELAQEIEKNNEKGISSMEITAIKAGAIMDEYLAKIGLKSKDQSEKFQQQVETNKKLLENTVQDINKKYDGSDIGLFNYKGHKESVEKHIDELNKYKIALQDAYIKTSLTYDSMSKQYSKDSEQFKKIQQEKKTALEELNKQMLDSDKILKDTNASYMSSWENRWKAVEAKVGGYNKEHKVRKVIDGELQKGVDSAFDTITKVYDAQIKTYEKQQKYLEEKNAKKKAALDKELKALTSEITAEKKALSALENEKQGAETKQKEYEAQMQRLNAEYGVKESKPKTEETDAPAKETPNNAAAHTAEEIAQAQKKFDDLQTLNNAEKKSAEEKATAIRQANIDIFESEQKVLDEKTRIENEKKDLDIKLAAEKEKLEKDKQKKEEQLKKVKRIKDKADHLVSIAKATTNIAEGITKALGYGPIIGPVLAAGLAVSGAVQMGIMAGQLKYMEDGGLLNGKRHSQGGMRILGSNIEVEGGEYVVNRQSTDKNLGLLSYINEQRRELNSDDMHTFFSSPLPRFHRSEYMHSMEKGGQVPMLPMSIGIDSQILQAIQDIDLQPRVSVVDINHMQKQVALVDEWVGMTQL